MVLPAAVKERVDAFLEAVDAEAPGLVEGFYLEGSVALGDFRLHSSDIDFVAVTASPPDTAGLVVLERVHTRLRERRPKPFFDGFYVTWADLAVDPALAGGGPHSQESRFHPDGGGRNPITWHTLAQCGVRCRGPELAKVGVWTDPGVLAAWTNGNLDAYWRRFLDRGARLFTRDGLAGLSEWAAAWCVLGVSRLHYTLATGEITSKEGAGVYALKTFPSEWNRLIEECLRIRRASGRRPLYLSPLSRRRETRAFTAMVIDDAHRLYLPGIRS